jgi:hypothetical protein
VLEKVSMAEAGQQMESGSFEEVLQVLLAL